MKLRPSTVLLTSLLAAAVPVPLGAQQTAGGGAVTAAAAPSYADLADLVLSSPVIADAVVRSTARLKPAEAPGLPAGRARLYVEADVTALVRGASGVASRIGYLADVPLDARGRVPKPKKARVLLFARPVAGGTTQVQLSAPDAQLPWTPALDEAVRRVTREAVAADAPPAVTGVGSAFHVPGALPGESETQLFVQTAGGRPMALSVLRRPGEQPRWAVALSEVVDEAAAAPRADTLLWYRLACGLPRALPPAATASLGEAEGAAAARDYRFVLDSLGPCGRTRGAATAG